jgi:CheY-like chemotaxis protein
MATILVVDDEFGIANLLEEVLEDEGHHVFLASNGRQGLEKAIETTPDLVITDFMMPIMDGAALIKALICQPGLKGIPIILMSAVPEATAAESCCGYTAYLRKPFNIWAVIDLVETLIIGEQGTAPS